MSPLVARYVHACDRVLARVRTAARYATGSTPAGSTTTRSPPTGSAPTPAARLMRRSRGLPYGAGVAATSSPRSTSAGNLTYVQARYLDPERDRPQVRQPGRRPRPPPPPRLPRRHRRRTQRRAARVRRHPRRAHRRPGRLPRRRACSAPTPPTTPSPPASPTTPPTSASTSPSSATPTRPAATSPTRSTDLLAGHDIHPTVITPPDGLDLNAWAHRRPELGRQPLDRVTSPSTPARRRSITGVEL